MKSLFFVFLFGFSPAFSANEVSRGFGFTLNINKEASMSMSILIKNTKENYVSDLRTCSKSTFSGVKVPRSLKCLSFHTVSGMAETPLSLVDLVDEDELTADTMKLAKAAQKEGKEAYSWGNVLSFKNESVHIYYLIPEDRTYSIRLGPVPDSLLANHDLQFAKVIWKFKD